MIDLNTTPEETAPESQEAAVENATPQPTQVIFKVGANRIVADETTARLTHEQVRTFLKATYPEVVNATIRDRVEGDTRFLEFLPQPGRKG